MSRKRLALLGLIMATALAAAGAAAAHRGAPSVQSVSAQFNATTVSQRYLTTCSVNGGDTFQATKAMYTGTATSSDPRLSGALTIRAWSLVDTTNGVGHLFGTFRIVGAGRDRAHGTLNAAIAGGKASGLARGFVHGRWGHLVASLGATFDPTAGFSSGSIGTGTAGAGFLRSGRWCHPPHWPGSQGS
ncbi:MAG TPA: hypothetical protein VE984_09165 [Gaiellaceae bacterium]|nr:hypothetical protein [Gaiellaceae bacterium]